MEKRLPELHTKLYSQNAVVIAAFVAGPLAAGYLIGENFKALGQPKFARNSLLLGILSSVLLFFLLYVLPGATFDKIPRFLIPVLCAGVTFWVVSSTQGAVLHANRADKNIFFSPWRVAAVAAISSVVLVAIFVGGSAIFEEKSSHEQYSLEIKQFLNNEERSLAFYEHLQNESDISLLKELDENVIPAWQENLEIVTKIAGFKDLPPELVKQNEQLLSYTMLRLRAFDLFKKNIETKNQQYRKPLQEIHVEIDQQIREIEANKEMYEE